MPATFTKALCYRVQFTCVTPMRIGVYRHDKNELLRRNGESVFLPSGSICGAFRAWKDSKLFGSHGSPSELIVSDGVFQNSKVIYRHRIALKKPSSFRFIDTGSGIVDSQQAIAVLPCGTTGEFSIVWKGREDFPGITSIVESYLAALDAGRIQLGAERSNDFGRVKLSVSRGCFDMTDYAQRNAWLQGQWDGTPISLPTISHHTAIFDVTAAMPKIYIDGAAGQNHSQENGQQIVPSSSIKGVLRRWCSLIAPVWKASSIVTSTFGSPYLRKQPVLPAKKLVVTDGTYTNVRELPASNRILVDPVSGSTSAPIQTPPQAISGDLHFQLRIDASQDKAIGLLLYALRDFGLGMFDLGSNHAIGWGYAQGITVRLSTPSGTGTLSVSNGTVSLDDPESIIAHYTKNMGDPNYDSHIT